MRETPKKYLRKFDVADRYGVDPRTVDRWVADGVLPKPMYLGRTPLWHEDDLDANDRRATAAAGGKP